MKDNELKFYEFWKEHCKGKVSVQTKYITEAYQMFYKRQYVGGTCTRCLQIVSSELKKLYERLDKSYVPVVEDVPPTVDPELEKKRLERNKKARDSRAKNRKKKS